MLISNINKFNIDFTSSQLNILAMADNHGSLATMPQLIKTVTENKEDIFCKSEEPSTLNLTAIAGDYFMYPEKTGLLTNKNQTIGDLQFKFLDKMIQTFKLAAGKNANFETVFALGNHDLEAGDKWVMNKLKKAPLTNVVTNVNLAKSPLIKSFINKNNNIVTSKIYEIPDDKIVDRKNHVLVLGLTIPREKFNGEKLSGTVFYDTLKNNKDEKELVKSDFRKTLNVLDYKVKEYKGKYPNGAVVILSHLGNPVSKMIAEEVPNIDVILNGHDHKSQDIIVDETLISSLGENNAFVKSIQLEFDDEGKVASINKQKYKTAKYAKIAMEDENLNKFVYHNLKNDLKPILQMDLEKNLSKQFEYSKNIRSSNSIMMNYITSGIKEAASLTFPELDFVGIPSKILRGGLTDENKKEFNNLDLIRMFGGANPDLSNIKIGKITGTELAEIIIENTLKNIKKPKEHGIIHWSDIQINRTLMEQIKNGESELHYINAIKVKNPETKKYEELDKYKKYTILLPNKYLRENMNNSQIKLNFITRFMYINDTYSTLFKEYIELIDNSFKLSDEAMEKRIL